MTWLVDAIEVQASLTRPPGNGPFPAIIMVAGSGPTDRNWNTPFMVGSNGSAALLAQVLADNGFVVLRYDKRASGPDAQANAARLADFAAGRPLQLEPTLSEGLRNLILSITQPFNQPFARELWITDAPALLAAVTVPVLILIGKKDIQVDWQADGPLFEALAQAQPNIEVVYPPDANHVLKHEPRDRETLTAADASAGYNAEGTQLDAEAVEIVLGWLKKMA